MDFFFFFKLHCIAILKPGKRTSVNIFLTLSAQRCSRNCFMNFEVRSSLVYLLLLPKRGQVNDKMTSVLASKGEEYYLKNNKKRGREEECLSYSRLCCSDLSQIRSKKVISAWVHGL